MTSMNPNPSKCLHCDQCIHDHEKKEKKIPVTNEIKIVQGLNVSDVKEPFAVEAGRIGEFVINIQKQLDQINLCAKGLIGREKKDNEDLRTAIEVLTVQLAKVSAERDAYKAKVEAQEERVNAMKKILGS